MKQVIKDYPNYLITTSGKVLSAYKGGEELVPRVGARGYAYVNLYNEKGRKTKKIHRLVAETFIPNPENKPMVNHKDGNKLNNHVENLEWVTPSENAQHAVDNGLLSFDTEAHKRASRENGKMFGGRCGRKIFAMNVINGYIKTFKSVSEAVKYLNVTENSLRTALKKSKCINGYHVWYTDTLATTMDEEPKIGL